MLLPESDELLGQGHLATQQGLFDRRRDDIHGDRELRRLELETLPFGLRFDGMGVGTLYVGCEGYLQLLGEQIERRLAPGTGL